MGWLYRKEEVLGLRFWWRSGFICEFWITGYF